MVKTILSVFTLKTSMNKILLISVFSILTLNIMAQEKIIQTAGRTQLGEFASKFAELNDDVLFGQGRSWATAYISYQMKNVNAAY